MRDEDKTREQLVEELAEARCRIAELEALEREWRENHMALREDEADLQDLLENANDLVQSVTPEGRFVYVNRAWRETLGYSKDEVASLSLFDVIHPDSLTHCMEVFQKILSGEEAGKVEAVFVTKDGREVVVEGSANCRFEEGEPVYTRGIFRDVTVRRIVDKVLQESERRYRLLAENVTDVIWTMDMDMRFDYISPSVERLRGYTVEEAMKQTMEEGLTPESFEIAVKAFEEELAAEGVSPKDQFRSRTLELEQKCKDGSTVSVEVNVTFLRDEDGQPIGVLGISRDISRRKQAEALFRSLFTSSPIGIYIVQNGKFKMVNPSFRKLTGYSEDELVGMNSLDIVLPEDRNGVREKAVKMLKGERSAPYELRYVTKGGDSRWFMETVTSVRYQGEQAALGNFMDVTEYKQAEDELRESEKRFKELADLLPQIVFETDEKANYTFVNRGAFEVSGYTQDDLDKGLNALQTFIPEDHERLISNIERISRGERSTGNEYTAVRKDGSTFPVIVFTSPIIRENRPVGLRGVAVDITERKLMEEKLKEYSGNLQRMVEERTRELKEAQEKLVRSEKLAAIGQVAGGLAHELRSPLAAIKFSADYIRIKLGDTADEKVIRHLDLLEKQVDACDKTVTQTLDFARPRKLNVEEIDINQVIQAALEAGEPSPNVEVCTNLTEHLTPAIADAGQMGQVVSNLATNAVQAMPEGGTLTVATQQKGEYVEIRVSDTGVGIPEENLAKVFEPLFTTRTRGIGLGLAIVKTLVDRQNGTIEVKSRVGEGTTFTVRLPLAG
ncbi:MAG: PAS domain S-box protein [Chloroflexi bacterium]|nr:PAS domain S-box protein [Chloroflexota bacterium]